MPRRIRITGSLIPVMRKEFIHIKREPRLLVFLGAAPVLFLVLFGYALRLQLENVPMLIFDESRDFLSTMVKEKIWQEGYFDPKEASSRDELFLALKKGTAKAALHIPADFSRRILDGESGEIEFLVDGTMPSLAVAAKMGASSLTSDDFQQQLVFQDPDSPKKELARRPVKLKTEVLFNPGLRDQNFFLPGIMGILIMQVALVITSTALVKEREYKTYEQLIVTPVGKPSLILGKIAPYALIAFLDFWLVVGVGHLVFKVPVMGSRALMLVLAIVYIIALLSLGMLISTFSDTQQQAIFFAVFIIIPSIMLSGFVFPIEAMPSWLHPLPAILPLTYFLNIMRGIMLKGSGLDLLYPDFLVLLGFCVLFAGASIARFKKTIV